MRPYFTDSITKPYFLPAFMLKAFGAISLGLVYQFYYGGGDTFAFHTHGSAHIFEAFLKSPEAGFRLLLANGNYEPVFYEFARQIWYFRDEQTYFVIRLAAIADLFTFGTYSATALLFALFAFFGLWSLFQVAYRRFPEFHFQFAFGALFIPSVAFWGSGILKDTITLGAVGFIVYSFDSVFFRVRRVLWNLVLFVLMCFVVYSIKKYILLSILPALIFWYFLANANRVRNTVLRTMIYPVFLVVGVSIGYVIADRVGEDDPRYALENLSQTAAITAYDIRYGWGARFGENSGYTLGELDGSLGSLLRLAPAAINVSLFRPYLWEVRNPFMLLSAVESLFLLALTLWVLRKSGLKGFFKHAIKPFPLFCFTFSILFAFAVGVSTFNFGTLARYKIPLMPLYLFALFSTWYYSKRDKNLSELARTE